MATEITFRVRVPETNAKVDEQALAYDVEDMFTEMYGVEATAEVVDVEEV